MNITNYQEAFAKLNTAQKQAVEAIEGPVLVIAGPGTGKTQLLSVRVAHILIKTDTLPSNILCLTFTENGAENMRERLTRFIGQEAHKVNISTYHAFGGELIQRFPEAFAATRLQTPADELTKHQVLRDIIDALPYSNPLKQLRHHLGDLVATISEVKRALLSAESLRAIASENNHFIDGASRAIQDILDGSARLPASAAKIIPLFKQVLEQIQPFASAPPAHHEFASLAQQAVSHLKDALETAAVDGKSPALTAWKNTWLAKDANNRYVFDGRLQNQRLLALAEVLEAYQAALAAHGWYDFDDMILRAIEALQKNSDLRYSLQEQYLYILLDEFQDTNAAQLRLVQLLTNNPVHEDRPNVLAVGDDNQAIYAFQGAQYSNVLDFYHMYRGVKLVSLAENYRSHPGILHIARGVAKQIENSLAAHFKDINKALRPASSSPSAAIERRDLQSEVAQADWIAHHIQALLDKGVSPSQIAILAPKHRQLEPLVPHLTALNIPVRYEKRENVLEAPIVRQLISMSKLVIALADRQFAQADALWPEVLSFDFWQIPTSELWQFSWEIRDTPQGHTHSWSQALLASKKMHFHNPALLMLALAGRLSTATCEELLDALIGTTEVLVEPVSSLTVRSPLREFYTRPTIQQHNPQLFYDTLSHLIVLRARLREHQATGSTTFSLRDLIRFVRMYEESGERMQSTSPHNQHAIAVQLMTVFKAKGLEFEHVFLPSCQHEVWGAGARGNSNKLTLPPNLAPIRHAGASDDERLRLLFVAITRAKTGLYFTNFTHTFTGKQTKRCKYLDEQEQADGSVKSMVLPEGNQTVLSSKRVAPALTALELNWRHRHHQGRHNDDLRVLLADRLQRYQLSPTHLTTFLDLEYGGPEQFFFQTLLGFPQAPTAGSQFGSAIHSALEWAQLQTNVRGNSPSAPETIAYFAERMRACKLAPNQIDVEVQRGEKALAAYIAQRAHSFRPGNKAEHNFRYESVFIDKAHLAGKIDRLEIDTKNKTVAVVDYKTGKAYAKWSSQTRLHLYQLQLYCYKLLLEGSQSYSGYQVTNGRIEFVEPDVEGHIQSLTLSFSSTELARARQLILAMWQRVQTLTFPEVSRYPANLTGIKQFEAHLSGDVS